MDKISAKYIFLDVVAYSGRPADEQGYIVEALQKIVKLSVNGYFDVLDRLWDNPAHYLPTGDGMCIVLEGVDEPEDVHVKIAETIHSKIKTHNSSSKFHFEVRIGINEGKDVAYNDINEQRNYAGRGINHAQRAMSFANAGQICVAQGAYEVLANFGDYKKRLHPVPQQLKDGENIFVYYLDYAPENAAKRKRSTAKTQPKNEMNINGAVSNSVVAQTFNSNMTIFKGDKKPKLPMPANSIANDAHKRGYIKYLADRYNKWRAMDEAKGGMKYEVIWNNIKTVFGNDAYMNSVDKFDQIVRYVQERIDNTTFGKKNRKIRKRNYHTFEEHLAKGTDE
ncbi:hypothetical protein JNL27_06825 [bacterium]|nr:hypothetical protein [bacterium]